MADASAILKLHERLVSARTSSVETVWRDCFDFSFPLRGSGLGGATTSANTAQTKQADLTDSTAADSANTLASNIIAGLTPANALWFELDVGNETQEERAWLDDSARVLWDNIHNSNYDAEAFECALDMVCAGLFALYIDDDRDRGGFSFQQWPLAQVWVGSTRADRQIDIVHRKYPLTADAALREFGMGALPERVRKALEDGKGDQEFQFLHAIYPRDKYVVGAKMAKNLPIASCHIEIGSKTLVRESGYHEMPVVVPRWLRVPDSMYAVGPMYAALPDVRQVNDLKRLQAAAADIAVSGMWIAKDDGVLNSKTVKLGPRKVIIAADTDNMKALTSGADFNVSDMLVSQLQAAIRKTLMADNFPPPDAPGRTAYEWSVRVDMIRKLLGPIFGRLMAEWLRPMIERCFGLASRAGVFAPAPQSLRNRAYTVRYVSPLARAQKMEEVTAVEATFASVAQIAAIDETALDELDTSEALKIIIAGRGAPAKIQRSPDEVAQVRKRREQQQQKQMQQAGAIQAQTAGMEAAAKQAATG